MLRVWLRQHQKERRKGRDEKKEGRLPHSLHSRRVQAEKKEGRREASWEREGATREGISKSTNRTLYVHGGTYVRT